jgi:uncharacterized protein (DUF433 family)
MVRVPMGGRCVVNPSGSDIRFDTPLYSLAEAARYLGVPYSTFASWRKGYAGGPQGQRTTYPPVLPSESGDAAGGIPFISLAEGMVLAAIRQTGVPMQRIRPALLALREEIGVAHALASRRLFSDGAEVLYDFAEKRAEPMDAGPTKDLVVLRSGQRVFTDVVSDYLQRIEYGPDGYAKLLHLPGYLHRQVIADPTRSFGQPVFVHGAARVSDVLDRFQAGDSLPDLAEDFGVPMADLEDALRVASRRAA